MKSRRECECPCHADPKVVHVVPCCDGMAGLLKTREDPDASGGREKKRTARRSMPCKLSMDRRTLLLLLTLLVALPGVCIAQPDKTAAESDAACAGDTVDQLGLQAARDSRAFVARLKSATDSDNRTAVSAMVRYPLAVHIGDRTFRVHSPEEFLREYDRIISAAVRKAIDDPQSSKCLFFSSDGFMIGNGEVWFQKMPTGAYKVIAINLGAVPATP